jgi:hypothetical protein
VAIIPGPVNRLPKVWKGPEQYAGRALNNETLGFGSVGMLVGPALDKDVHDRRSKLIRSILALIP